MGSIAQLVETYLTACEVEGKSPRTIRGYGATLHKFVDIVERHDMPRDVEAFTVPDVYAYLAVLRERTISRAYQHRLHREVKTFFSWCKRLDKVPDNVFARVPIVKLEQQIIQPFSPEEIRALLSCIKRKNKAGARNYALVLFLLDTGVRASECVSVRLDDVDWENGRVRVLHGKGQKQRWVGLGADAQAALRDYISRIRGEAAGPLFLSTKSGEGIRSLVLNTLLRRLGTKAAVTKVHPHRFRHTFATWAIRSQAREIDVQSLLGHSSLTMVQRYARTYSSEQAVLAHGGFSPVGQLGIG